MRILLISVTLTFVFSSTGYFLVTSANYKPFLVIALAGALSDIAFSLALIPYLHILGASLAQASTDLVVSALTLFYSVRAKAIPFTKTEKAIVLLSPLTLLGLTSVWPLSLVLVLLCYRYLGLIKRVDVEVVRKFTPSRFKGAVGVLELLCNESENRNASW